MAEAKASFMDRLVSEKGRLIHKLCAVDETGRQAYYYVLIEPHKLPTFEKALQSGSATLNFEDYGKVVASCYGDNPTEEVKQLLKDKYGFEV